MNNYHNKNHKTQQSTKQQSKTTKKKRKSTESDKIQLDEDGDIDVKSHTKCNALSPAGIPLGIKISKIIYIISR